MATPITRRITIPQISLVAHIFNFDRGCSGPALQHSFIGLLISGYASQGIAFWLTVLFQTLTGLSVFSQLIE